MKIQSISEIIANQKNLLNSIVAIEGILLMVGWVELRLKTPDDMQESEIDKSGYIRQARYQLLLVPNDYEDSTVGYKRLFAVSLDRWQ